MYYGTPPIVTNGLVLNLDAANTKSYVSGSTVWRDVSGNNNSGSLVGGPGYNSNNGGIIVFDGINDYSTILDHSSLNFGSGAFTIECVFRPKSTQSGGNFPAVLNKSTGDFSSPAAGVTGWILYWQTIANTYQFQLGDGTPGAVNTLSYPASVTNDNTWRCLSVTIPTSGSSIIGYYNGNPVGSSTRTLGSTNINVELTIATWRQFNRELNTDIGVVRIYNRALTQAEVTQNYNALKSRFALS